MDEIKEIGRYKVEQYLGSGTFANVYLAVDTQLQREVALKILKPTYQGDEEIYNRFKVEALSAANLCHPHIAWVWDMGEANGSYYITIRYIAGQSLDKVIREKGWIPWRQALRFAMDTGEALSFAHARSIIHRDVKPQNIMISPVEGAVLTDFGLAKAMLYSGLQTRSGGVVGTPQYVPGEVWNGEPTTKAVDQYALACVLCEMLTGRILYQASTLEAIIKKHFTGPYENWYPLPQEAPQGLSKVIRKALSPSPADRYPDVMDFIQALNQFLAVPEDLEQKEREDGRHQPEPRKDKDAPTPPEPVKRPVGPETPRVADRVLNDIQRISNIFDRSPKPASSHGSRRIFLGTDPKAKTVKITKKVTVLGRLGDNDIKFADPEVSRRHARIVETNGALMIEDLNSANGTYVNNVRVSRPVVLKDGDRIRLGKTVELIYRDH